MSTCWPQERLSAVVRERKAFVTIDDFSTYKRCRVQLHAKGIVLRDKVDGSAIRTKSQQVCRAGEFLVAEIDAKLGGYGIVPDELDGAIVSSHYFLFEIDEERLDRAFLGYYIRTPAFFEQVRAQGSTNYAAIRPSHVLGYRIPLPPLAEQRRIVAKIDQLAAKIAEARALRDQAAAETMRLFLAESRNRLNCRAPTKVGDFLSVQSGYAFKSDWFTDDGIRLVRNVNIGHGKIDWGQTARIPMERRGEFARFDLRDGDILITLDRPIISTGVKVARVGEADIPSLLLQRVGRVQFKNDAIAPEFLFAWLRSPHFVDAIDPGRSNGVPHISPKDVERIAFAPPPLSEQRHTVAYLDDLQAKVDQLKALQAQTAAELDVLLPAILDKAFKGEL